MRKSGLPFKGKVAETSSSLSSDGITANVIENAKLVYASASTVDIGESGVTSKARSDDDTYTISWTGALTADITSSGANGLDTGSEAADTWYYVWVIEKSSDGTTASLLSTSSTAPTMPTGYDKKRRVGCVRNFGNDFFKFFQFGKYQERTVFYDEDDGVTDVLAFASGTNWTDVDCSSLVPPTSQLINIMAKFQGNTKDENHAMKIRINGSTEDDVSLFLLHNVTAGKSKNIQLIKMGTLSTGDGQAMYYLQDAVSWDNTRATVLTPPTGQAIKIQLRSGDNAGSLSDVFSEAGPDNRISIGDGSYESGFHSPDNVSTIPSWGVVVMDIDQVGSGNAGADLCVTLDIEAGDVRNTALCWMPTDENQIIEYKGSNSSNRNHIYCRGYKEWL